MNCAELAPLLPLAALPPQPGDGDEPPLPAGEAARVAAHLAVCPACRQVAESLTHAFRGVEPMSRETAVLEPLTPELRARTLLAVEEALAQPASRALVPPAVEPVATARRADADEEGDDSLLREFLLFLREEKRWWMAPLLTVLLMLSVVIVFAEGSAIAPFIYTLF